MARNKQFLTLALFTQLSWAASPKTDSDFEKERPYRDALEQCEQTLCAELPVLLERVGRLDRRQGHYEDAARRLERSVGLQPSVTAMNAYAETLRDLGDVARAESWARRAVDASQGTGTRAHSLGVLGGILESRGEWSEAAAILEESLALARQLQPPDRLSVAEALNNLGMVRHKQGRVEVAGRLYEEALALLGGSSSLALPVIRHNLATVRTGQGKNKEAMKLLEQALTQWEQFHGPHHPNVAAALNSMAAIEIQRKHWKAASQMLDRASKINRESFPPAHPRIASDLYNRASLAQAGKNFREAADLLEQVLALYQQGMRADHPEAGKTWVSLARAYSELADRPNAIRSYRTGLDILAKAWGPNDLRLAQWIENYARILREEEDFAEAAKQEMHAMRIRVSNTLR